MRTASRLLSVIAVILASASAHALELRVGTGTGCTHSTLQAALTAIAGMGGSHNIRINAGNYATADGMVYQPSVAQAFVVLEGGYANCTAASPSGSATTDAGRSIFSGAGGLGRSVLQLQINGLTGSFQMRRIALQDGDALNTTQLYNHGGGLAIYGNASVLLGSGVTVRNNSAGYGGGIALVGGSSFVNDTLARPDLFIDEGAEIRNNTAVADGGGIYCGGALTTTGNPPSVPRLGSIVHRDGSILSNQAGSYGSAISCRGSYAGGGYQPRPRSGALALVANNGNLSGNYCAISATLDMVFPTNGAGERVLGADDASNGLLVLSSNTGTLDAGLCVENWGDRGGASPAPGAAPRFVIQNAWFSNNTVAWASLNTVSYSSALRATGFVNLTLRPSSDSVVCSGSNGPCVLFEYNGLDAGFPAGVVGAVVAVSLDWGTALSIERARFTGNVAQEALVELDYQRTAYRQLASIVDGNIVNGANSVLYRAEVRSGAGAPPPTVLLLHNTITANTHSRFFQLDDSSALTSQGNVLHAASSRLLRFGDSPAGNLTLQWCNYLTTTADAGYTGATQVTDGFGTLVTVIGPLTFGADFAPPFALIDQCHTPQVFFPTTATLVDFDGSLFGNPIAPVNPNRTADLGATEFYPDIMFQNGFEAP
jgi:predicted outer membrane repeat protein